METLSFLPVQCGVFIGEKMRPSPGNIDKAKREKKKGEIYIHTARGEKMRRDLYTHTHTHTHTHKRDKIGSQPNCGAVLYKCI